MQGSLNQSNLPEIPKGPSRVQEFLEKLTQLSNDCGIGITGTAVLFVLESDDYERRYRSNEASLLEFR